MMTITLPLSRSLSRSRMMGAGLGAIALAAVAGTALFAQVSGDRGIAPVASSTDIVANNITVDVHGKTAEEARQTGWREAQRKAWEKLGGPDLPDSRIESMVAAVVIDHEQLGPRRYIATLDIIFDRSRAGSMLGGGGKQSHSAPMLTLPVLIDGGAATMFETRNPWQRVWANFQAGGSAIDYVRPAGAGGESLLLTYGQTGRRSRLWWNTILSEFGAADVIIPIARLQHEWPGGPITGTFTARYGPDNRLLGEFTLRAENDSELEPMLERAVHRFDDLFASGLAEGKLKPDPTLESERIEISPEIRRLIEVSRQAEAAEQQERTEQAEAENPADLESSTAPQQTEQQAVSNFAVQFTTPNAAAVDAALAAVRSAPGVRGAATSSIAIGGTSVMRVSYAGDLSALAATLRARGWNVTEGSNALSISR
ncbi:heavy-metal-associated domain-containing protein [Altericroceibacterium spongiae]|uniref:Heavy-metal-associated domain-containing protein n=1 Tax=Altericroceibacterium spongiae TaxID=2320269 RepID=A0A420ER77_9SPHN|nr:heavy-metal-associated domain-containing protein [Altericroceibacterium spongiae]RKF23179.1 heavy-metal-associated domain-containing protein [Altericroceibacterium spongiae]